MLHPFCLPPFQPVNIITMHMSAACFPSLNGSQPRGDRWTESARVRAPAANAGLHSVKGLSEEESSIKPVNPIARQCTAQRARGAVECVGMWDMWVCSPSWRVEEPIVSWPPVTQPTADLCACVCQHHPRDRRVHAATHGKSHTHWPQAPAPTGVAARTKGRSAPTHIAFETRT